MKVKDFFKLPEVLGDVGVEIEVEGRNLPPAPKGWRAEVDGSLKAAESIEFVMRNPVPLENLQEALKSLKEAFEKRQSVFDKSYRAGIHTHINVQELSMVQLATMLSTYYIFENSLVNLCDPFRKGNHFCLRAEDASGQIRFIQNAFKENRPQNFLDDNLRYSSMNVCAIPKYGSVEFRSMESTYDFGKVETFASLHVSIRDFATKVKDPSAMIEEAYYLGPVAFCNKVLGKNSPLLSSQKDFYNDCERGLEFAEDLAFCRPWGVRSLDIFSSQKEVF